MKNEYKSKASQSTPKEAGGHDLTGMGTPGTEGPTSGPVIGKRADGESHSNGATGRRPIQDAQTAGDHLRSRRPEGIWPEDLDEVEFQLTEAFLQGNPALAWSLTKRLLGEARALMVEAAKARFEVNFGTPVCERCDGLRAGDDVVATCYQMKLCYYRSMKKDTNPKQKGVIDKLSGFRSQNDGRDEKPM